MAEASWSQNSPNSDLTPIASSEPLGWQPLLAEEFQHPPGGTDILEAWEGHSIALCLAPRPHRIHQVVGDLRYTGLYTKGDISITPANIPASYWTEGDDHYFHVQIPTQFLRAIAQSAAALDPDRIELTNEFRVRDPQLEQTLMLLRSELHKGDGWVGQLYVESLANVLAINLLRDYSSTKPRLTLDEGGLGDSVSQTLRERRILQISEYIHEHLDQSIKLADLADVVGISQFHFSRLFKQSMGITAHQYLLQQRIEQAKQLLKGTKLAIAEIALQCGFNSQSHLSKHFRAATGTTPSNYRRN